MRHIAPTAPDTLRAFPFVDEDPFVLHEAPHIYFAGNQEIYGERLIQSGHHAVKLIAIPAFHKTKSIVLLDVTSLESYEITLDLSQGFIPIRDSA
jgi:DNA polymerase delta subunit 2